MTGRWQAQRDTAFMAEDNERSEAADAARERSWGILTTESTEFTEA